MKVVFLCLAVAIVAALSTEKDATVRDFQNRCLGLTSIFSTISSLFGFNNNQVVTYPPVYYEEPVYWYYPVYNNQEVIYEYYPQQEYFYNYPSYEYDIYSDPTANIYYYNSIGNNGRMQRQEISQNTYNEYARRNVVIRARQTERGIDNTRQEVEYQRETETRPVQGRPVYETEYEQRPVRYETEYEQRPVRYETEYEQRPVEYETRPVQGRPVEYETRPVQGRPVEYETRPVQGRPVEYETRPVQGRPVEYETRPVQGRPVVYEQVVQPRPVVARPVQVVAVSQRVSPLQSLLGRPQPQPIMIQPAAQPVQYVRN